MNDDILSVTAHSIVHKKGVPTVGYIVRYAEGACDWMVCCSHNPISCVPLQVYHEYIDIRTIGTFAGSEHIPIKQAKGTPRNAANGQAKRERFERWTSLQDLEKQSPVSVA